MCRSIRVLHNFDPPTTPEEMAAAALQYVRKVSGLHHASHHDEAAFDAAVRTVTAATEKLLAALHRGAHVRTREGEREKARARWKQREERMAQAASAPAPAAKTAARPGRRR
ncbi:MAG TPA: DUF2277 domain-containing protein [Myxococcaceae bacterium]|nr:DUF2277 domain-containing protein [Myxococcaceae bacterium]